MARSPEWPRSFATVFRDVLPDHLLRDVLAEADAWASCPNYWVPKADFTAPQPRSLAEAVVREVFQRCVRPLLDDSSLAGAEWWVQVYRPGHGLAFHFDKDEALFADGGAMKHPTLSSILYLTGGSSTSGPWLGPTVVIDQQFDNEARQAIPEQPERCALVWPHRNSLAVFDGRLGHGVLDSASKEQRSTMLINWWPYRPQAVNVRPDEANVHAAGSPAAKSAHSEQPAALPIPVPVLRLPSGEEGAVYTVDDLLEGHGLAAAGESAPQAVAFEHPGFRLYPVGADDEQISGLRTAAAFVWGVADESGSSSEE